MCKQHADKARCIGYNMKTTVDNDFCSFEYSGTYFTN